MNPKNFRTAILAAIPILIVVWIWLSSLSFVPVPWPDDSAFYFVGREFFKWPPRWVMLPQAPFEPTYRIYNFNTMPLYPMILGLGRLLGIDGSFAIKFWPLTFFALSGSLLGAWLYRTGLPFFAALLVALTFILDPGSRWGAVIVRPESLIGLCGMAIVLGLTFGFPRRLQPRGLWDPVAGLLAIAAYSHFNAVHLLFPVLLALLFQPLRLIRIGTRTLLYLTPWMLTVILKPGLFVHQMTLQWSRLAVRNDWLDSPAKAVSSLFQDMGSPEPWPAFLQWTALAIWLLIFGAVFFGLVFPLIRWALILAQSALRGRANVSTLRRREVSGLMPAAGWVIGTVWLFGSKPEVWFTYYIHTAVWTFAGIALWVAWRLKTQARGLNFMALVPVGSLLAFSLVLFVRVDVIQASHLAKSPSWHWDTYHDYISCIDDQLIAYEKRLGHPQPFRVWCPTFPDITIELSRRHPDWELTRTNDFWNRSDLAVQHGRDVEAVVVSEMINWQERTISAKASDYPTIQSAWMTWDQHFLNRLWTEKDWKPERYLCQRGRWQAFIFEK
jgi:hypothetical protein